MLKMNSVLSVVLALCFASLAYSFEFGYEPTYNDEFAIDENEEWEQFKIKFMKKYDSPEEEELRRDLFVKSLRETQDHNLNFKRGNVSYLKAINKFSDLFPSEVPMGLKPVPSEALKDVQYYQPPFNVSVPREVDWRTQGVVTEVKDQGTCLSCWAFATTGVLESQIAIHHKTLVSLSEQNLVDCNVPYNDGCRGGNVFTAYNYILVNGLDSEQSYPYEYRQAWCRYNSFNVAGLMKSWLRVPPMNEEALKIAVAMYGPIAVTVDATSLNTYHKHIYKSDICSPSLGRANHSMLVVGYGTTEEGEDYWIVKNSWGRGFGEDGYVRIARNYNMCGIANFPTFPIV